MKSVESASLKAKNREKQLKNRRKTPENGFWNSRREWMQPLLRTKLRRSCGERNNRNSTVDNKKKSL